MTLFTSIVLISFYQILIVHGQGDDSSDLASAILPDTPSDSPLAISSYSSFFGVNLVRLDSRLDAVFPGDTTTFDSISSYLVSSEIANNQCQLKFSRNIRDPVTSRFLVGTIGHTDTIVSVTLTFYNENNDRVTGDDGQPMQYTSTPHDLGHILNIFNPQFDFSYAKCLLNLRPNSNFNLNNLFFHFSQALSGLTIDNTTSLINGPTFVYTDTIAQMYNISINCRLSSTCMWLLDNDVISSTSNTSVLLIFEQRHLGNRTLSYVVYIGNIPQVLASLLLSILPMAGAVCRCLSRRPKDIFISAGNLNVPRVYFTATYLLNNQSIIIIGGKADDASPLSSVEIFNLETGCINMFNVNYARMKHATTYFNDSDSVIVIGGLNSTGVSIQSSEVVTISNAQIVQSTAQARYSHAIANINSTHILVVGGQGLTDNTKQIETFSRITNLFQTVTYTSLQLNNLEGHSVTSLGDSGSVLIFGGFNGSTYFGTGLLFNGTDFITVGLTGLTTVDSELKRAHHQATYIPSIDAVLITGGDRNGQVLNSCYLYYCSSKTFNVTTAMKTSRSFHAAVIFNNNSVLVTGGAAELKDGQPSTPLISVERYDAATNLFIAAAPLILHRSRHEAVLVSYNEVFVFGGIGTDGNPIAAIEYIMLTIWSNDCSANND